MADEQAPPLLRHWIKVSTLSGAPNGIVSAFGDAPPDVELKEERLVRWDAVILPPEGPTGELSNVPLLQFLAAMEEKIGSNALGKLDAAVLVCLEPAAQVRIFIGGFGIKEADQVRVLEMAAENMKQKVARDQVMNPSLIIARP